jgi:ketosteroid isomerase-like protein
MNAADRESVRQLGFAAVLAFVVALPCLGQTVADAEQELARIEGDWRTARLNGDVGFLERLYAPELRITGTDGSIIERNADIAGFASGAIKPESIDRSEMRISIYGDAAVVIGRDDLKGRYNGVVGGGAVRFGTCMCDAMDQWQLVASQGTWIQQKLLGQSFPTS